MADIKIMKAVEYDKLPAKFRKQYTFEWLEDKYWLQKKYDGCFGMAVVAPGGHSTMSSRTGETVRSCDHILLELEEAAQELAGDATFTPFVVLGEVWSPDHSFPYISGKFRQHGAAENLHFIANDLLPLGLETHEAYAQRLENLKKLLPDLKDMSQCKVSVAYTMERFTDARAWACKWVAEGGYDGAILRDPWASYTVGLVKQGEIVKVKPTMSLDLEVDAITTAVGEKTGRPVYTLLVRYRNVQTTVGSGVPHKHEDLPEVGGIVEVECLGLTEDGKLREPRFKGVRHDKEEPDT